MATANIPSAPTNFDDLVTMVRRFADGLRSLLALDEEGRADILTLLDHAREVATDEIDRDSAYAVIAQVLFPGSLADDDSEAWEWPEAGDELVAREMDREEATFADRVAILMKEKKMTQAELAEAVGVGQPAISLMLSRSTRPQRRTVEKIAEALGVTVGHLWPSYEDVQVPAGHPVGTGWASQSVPSLSLPDNAESLLPVPSSTSRSNPTSWKRPNPASRQSQHDTQRPSAA